MISKTDIHGEDARCQDEPVSVYFSPRDTGVYHFQNKNRPEKPIEERRATFDQNAESRIDGKTIREIEAEMSLPAIRAAVASHMSRRNAEVEKRRQERGARTRG